MGNPDRGNRLLDEAEALDLDPLQTARASWSRAFANEGNPTDPDKLRSLLELVEAMRRDGDTAVALSSLFNLAAAAWWIAPDAATCASILAVADSLPVPADDPQLIAILALVAPIERGAVVLERTRNLRAHEGGDPWAMRQIGLAISVAGAIDDSIAFCTAAAIGMRAQGRLGLLAQNLLSLSLSELVYGSLRSAHLSAREGVRLGQETGQTETASFAELIDACVCALRGDGDPTASAVAAIERAALLGGARPLLALAQTARGLSALVEGRHSDAFDHLLRVFDPGDPAHHPFFQLLVISDLADATAGSGRHEEAEAVFARLERLAESTPSPILHAGLSFARAVLARGACAEPLFLAALSEAGPRWPLLRARLLLAWGTWLRHQRRIAESRSPLRAARDAFDTLGARPWEEQARRELRAAGEVSTHREPLVAAELTAQELQVARMAAQGLTNREIGERLFLSHRTVGAHLLRAFPKLGITSRAQLGAALTELKAG
jgi:DNA-binding CsgD family transcriptional regulator